MIKAIIIDDEQAIRQATKARITSLFPEEVTVVAESDSVEGGISIIDAHLPDIVFLDIEINGVPVLTF